VESLQNQIFILEYKLKLSEKDILDMPYWILKYRIKQLDEINKMQEEEHKKLEQQIKSKSSSISKFSKK